MRTSQQGLGTRITQKACDELICLERVDSLIEYVRSNWCIDDGNNKNMLSHLSKITQPEDQTKTLLYKNYNKQWQRQNPDTIPLISGTYLMSFRIGELFCEKSLKIPKVVIRICKSKKDRHHNGQKKKGQKDKQRSTKHYTEKDQVTRTPRSIFTCIYYFQESPFFMLKTELPKNGSNWTGNARYEGIMIS